MGSVWGDVRYGLRALARTPTFTLAALLTLALGVGANTAVFSVVHAVLLQPLSLPDSDRLVVMRGRDKEGRAQWLSYPDFQDVRREARSFTGFSGFVPQSVNLTGQGEPTRVRGGFVSADFFEVAGVAPALGRGFLPGEDEPGAERVCVVQHATWQSVFAGEEGILGRRVVLNNEPFTVVGVLPEGFRFPFDDVEVWLTYPHWPPFEEHADERATGLVAPVARLKPGLSMSAAQVELDGLMARLASQYPEAGEGRGLHMTLLHENVVRDVRQALLVLLAAVAFVLLIACANVANLMLARFAAQERQLATRAALGAGRLQLVRQILAEGMLLWLGGGLAGLLVAGWGVDLLLLAAPEQLPGGIRVGLSGQALAYGLGVSLLSGLAFGLVPALRLSRPGLARSLGHGLRAGDGTRRTRLRGALVVSQVALTLILLVGCGLMVQSLRRLTLVDPGFRADGLLTLEYRLPENRYPDPEQQWAFHQQVLERVRALPGVLGAGLTRGLPFSGNGGSTSFELPDRGQPAGESLRAQAIAISDGLVETLGIPLLRGRTFEPGDTADAPPVILVNQSMAERHWSESDPLGQQVRLPGDEPLTATIVGIVGDVRQYSLEDAREAQLYFPQAQAPGIFNTLAVRTEGDPLARTADVRAALWSVDPDQPVWKIRTAESLVERSTGLRRFLVQLLGAYSGLALLLAAIGLYGVVAHAVTQRTREIGVRMALGAEARDVVRLVLSGGARLVSAGSLLGVAGALALGGFVRGLLFATPPTDPAVLLGTTLLLAGVAFVASYLPARRASRIQPLTALREE